MMDNANGVDRVYCITVLGDTFHSNAVCAVLSLSQTIIVSAGENSCHSCCQAMMK